MPRPEWLTLKAPSPQVLDEMQKLLARGHLHTVCEGADCPNIGECFANHTCTFMILGAICTRNCRFCAVQHGRPSPVDPGEPEALAATARELGIRHVVVTSVTRDDLPDGGAGHFAATIRAIRREVPGATVEVLIPDFQGDERSLQTVIEARPDIINHNIETVPRLYSRVRPQAIYRRSLQMLTRVAGQKEILAKSGLMLGLGETREEILQVMDDLHQAGCQILTLGQYLQPTDDHLPVQEFIHPDTFNQLKEEGYRRGFLQVEAGPLVRSSYHAAGTLENICRKGGMANGQSRQIRDAG